MGQEKRSAMERMNHGIHKDLVLQPAAPACAGNRVGNTRHMFRTTGKDDIGHAGLDHGHA